MCNDYEQHVAWREYCKMMQSLELEISTRFELRAATAFRNLHEAKRNHFVGVDRKLEKLISGKGHGTSQTRCGVGLITEGNSSSCVRLFSVSRARERARTTETKTRSSFNLDTSPLDASLRDLRSDA